MDLRAISDELRHGDDPGLRLRRRIATLAGLLAADFALVGMYQYGAIRRLPDVPVPGFDADAVMTAPSAYPFGIPDAAVALVGLGGIIALATAGGSERTGRPRALDTALGVAVLGGTAASVYFVDDMVRRRKRLCAYCLGAAVGFFAMLPLAARLFAKR